MGKRYDKEFKIEAVRLASEPGGIISRWARELQNDGAYVFPGKGRQKLVGEEMSQLTNPPGSPPRRCSTGGLSCNKP